MKSMNQQDSSDEIIKSIQSSNLHYSVSETPFSVSATLRKKFLKSPGLLSNPKCKSTLESYDLLEEISSLKNTIVDLHRLLMKPLLKILMINLKRLSIKSVNCCLKSTILKEVSKTDLKKLKYLQL